MATSRKQSLQHHQARQVQSDENLRRRAALAPLYGLHPGEPKLMALAWPPFPTPATASRLSQLPTLCSPFHNARYSDPQPSVLRRVHLPESHQHSNPPPETGYDEQEAEVAEGYSSDDGQQTVTDGSDEDSSVDPTPDRDDGEYTETVAQGIWQYREWAAGRIQQGSAEIPPIFREGIKRPHDGGCDVKPKASQNPAPHPIPFLASPFRVEEHAHLVENPSAVLPSLAFFGRQIQSAREFSNNITIVRQGYDNIIEFAASFGHLDRVDTEGADVNATFHVHTGRSLYFPGVPRHQPWKVFAPHSVGGCTFKHLAPIPLDDPRMITPANVPIGWIFIAYFALQHHLDSDDVLVAWRKMCFALRAMHEQRVAFGLRRVVLYGIVCSGSGVTVYPSWLLDNGAVYVSTRAVASFTVYADDGLDPVAVIALFHFMLALREYVDALCNADTQHLQRFEQANRDKETRGITLSPSRYQRRQSQMHHVLFDLDLGTYTARAEATLHEMVLGRACGAFEAAATNGVDLDRSLAFIPQDITNVWLEYWHAFDIAPALVDPVLSAAFKTTLNAAWVDAQDDIHRLKVYCAGDVWQARPAATSATSAMAAPPVPGRAPHFLRQHMRSMSQPVVPSPGIAVASNPGWAIQSPTTIGDPTPQAPHAHFQYPTPSTSVLTQQPIPSPPVVISIPNSYDRILNWMRGLPRRNQSSNVPPAYPIEALRRADHHRSQSNSTLIAIASGSGASLPYVPGALKRKRSLDNEIPSYGSGLRTSPRPSEQEAGPSSRKRDPDFT